MWYTRLHMVHLVTQVPKGLPGFYYQCLGINIVELCMLLIVQHILIHTKISTNFDIVIALLFIL